MEVALRLAVKSGIGEQEFWSLTPYRLGLLLKEAGRRNQEQALLTGWFGERFARESRLQGPAHYVAEMLEGPVSAEIAKAMAEAELERMALQWGLEVEELAD